ncbi:hypothetical protein QFC20_002722 [Naganishia adeliensis]|uniref:Uncharacterized protein n=1 Tax=Naganishia adeliensis TaxID=92952 RepID=A0ACC2WIP1_9TREE|nr:hypothetical protein QFC20_002722 [Naganishia adeliensis]
MSTSGNTPLSSITKWEGTRLAGSSNFMQWQNHILAVSVCCEVHYLIEDVDVPNSSTVSRRRGPGTAITSTLTEEEKKAAKASAATEAATKLKHMRWLWALLFNSLEPAVTSRLSLAARSPVDHDAVLLWKELHERYDRTKGIRAAQLQHELLTVRLQPGGNVEHHFNKMRDLYNRIIISGQKFDDQQLALAMGTSVADLTEYGILVGVVLRTPGVTSDFVEEEITQEWIRLGRPGKDNDPNEVHPSGDRGLAAKSKQSQKTSKTDRPPRKFHCSEHPSANSSLLQGITVMPRCP